MEDHCILCGAIIPEGRQVCPACETITELQWMKDDITKNDHYQIALYPGVIKHAVELLKKLKEG